MPVCRCQRLFHTRDPFPIAGVEQLQFIPGHLRHQASAVGGTVHELIVHHHQASVAGALNIQFDKIDTQRDTPADGGDCVLRGVPRGSAMANSQNPLVISPVARA